MLTIGIDPHKQTHTAVVVNALGVPVAQRTVAVRREGFEQLLEWGRRHDRRASWVIEDVRHVSGSFERFLLDHGETVVRLAPRLMAGARQGMRERGKSDPIDALAIARAALREGIDTLPAPGWPAPSSRSGCWGCTASGSSGPDPADQRAALATARPLARLGDPQARADPSRLADQGRPTAAGRDPAQVRVRIARDMIRRVRELTRTINDLYEQLAALVASSRRSCWRRRVSAC